MERLKGGLHFIERLRNEKKSLMISQKSKGPLLSGIWLHGLPASLDWADDRPAVHHSSLLCCCRLSHVGAKVRVYVLNFVFKSYNLTTT